MGTRSFSNLYRVKGHNIGVVLLAREVKGQNIGVVSLAHEGSKVTNIGVVSLAHGATSYQHIQPYKLDPAVFYC